MSEEQGAACLALIDGKWCNICCCAPVGPKGPKGVTNLGRMLSRCDIEAKAQQDGFRIVDSFIQEK